MKKVTMLAVAAVMLLVTALSGCGGASSSASSAGGQTGVNKNAPLYNSLPQAIKDKGVIQLGSEIGYPPMEYYDTDGKTVLGFDKELSDLVAKQLGVPINWNNMAFDGLITALNSNRVDIVMASMMDTAERQQKVDFVDYYMEGTSILVLKGNPQNIKTIDDLCGKTVTVQRGTTQETVLNEQATKCQAGGSKLEILPFDKEAEALLQVKQGRAVATVEQTIVATYNIDQSQNAYEIAGPQVPNTARPTGIALNKDNAPFRDALQKALQATMDDGSYKTLVDKYKLGAGALTKATVNAGK